jgi:putative membrane protein
VEIHSHLKLKIMFYNGYHFFGMHLIWWIIWIILIFWIFALPYRIPGQRYYMKDSPLDILQRRLASGEITNEEYQEKKNILESDLAKQR